MQLLLLHLLRFYLNKRLLTSLIVIFCIQCGYGWVSNNDRARKTTQALRNHDKMKDGAIAQLSDQVMALTARMQEFERKQQMI
jgi:hypothetical protein